MSIYSEKLKDPRWQKKRLRIFERDSFQCRDCGEQSKQLQVHHSHYYKGDPWETPSGFLLTVCPSCHETRQRFEDLIKKELGLTLAATPIQGLQKMRSENGGVLFDKWQSEAIQLMLEDGGFEQVAEFMERLTDATSRELDSEI